MKTIYKAIVEQLSPLLSDNTLRWVDWDKGQLKKVSDKNRPPVNYPCALIRIGITSASDITDTIQNCKARITVTLAFDAGATYRTSGNATEEVRDKYLEPYDVIADVYTLLQGFSPDNNEFNPLHRISQSEVTHDKLFAYQIIFDTEFEDYTAEG